MGVGDIGDRLHVNNFEYRIGRRFEEHHFGCWSHGLFPCICIAPVNHRSFNAVARQQGFNNIAARAKQRARRHHMIAGLQQAQHGSRHRGHAGCRGARIFGPFQRHHAFFEHSDGRIAKPRINITVVFFAKAGFCLFSTVIDKAGSQIEGFAGLSERRPVLSLMDQTSSGSIIFFFAHLASPCGP